MAVGKGLIVFLTLINTILGADVKCPNPATNCLTETYNGKVFPTNGCLGCQDGCKPGFIQTYNKRYYQDSTSFGVYQYKNINISNKFNVNEPEWLCVPGDSCRPGYYLGMANNKYCAWCGEGCRHCSGFQTCQSCFGGYRRATAILFGNSKTTCEHSNVLCPVQPQNCEYKAYVNRGAGCIGCQLCKHGYTVTFNPKYTEKNTNRTAPYYDYKGLSIKDGININEPRYVCAKGTTCKDGFYSRVVDTVTLCEWCGEGCTSCTGRNACTACDSLHHLESTGVCVPPIIG
ncbi:hypothetical protein LOTGIDRAFT_233116 [Lottia gigantea]|uniref:Uncharacterized protein n=1 Tax=Lottia gigantea TaxID=225164 RepID=V3ZLY0_LOTGI|nr:hypothetical protein LOTGIDRAFT_233116 [Lottia gigantea]ESO92343.1 hypothetical protein LOTGIDRAFT_233116 [Lottia gigantea]